MIIVYIPGCWDLLHTGHLNALERARTYGDRLIVGVESDGLIYAEKGRHPAINQDDRCRMLQALRCVDAAIVFTSFDYAGILRNLNPDVLIFGNSHTQERHQAAIDYMKDKGRRVVRLPYTAGISTSEILERIKHDR